MTDGDPATVVGHGGSGPGFTVYVAATFNGSRGHGEAAAAEIDDRPLIQACLAKLQGTPHPVSHRPR
jgi:D-alanyl-D-alanine carboxypeptidase